MLLDPASRLFPELDIRIGARSRRLAMAPVRSKRGLEKAFSGNRGVFEFALAAKLSARLHSAGLDRDPARRASRLPVRIAGGGTLSITIDNASRLAAPGSSLLVIAYDAARDFLDLRSLPLAIGAQAEIALPDEADAIGFAIQLVGKGSIERVVITLGGAGAAIDGDDEMIWGSPDAGSSDIVRDRDGARSAPAPGSIDKAIELLAQADRGSADPEALRKAIDMLIRSPQRGAVARAARKLLGGATKASPAALILALGGARLFAQYNAYATTSALAEWIQAQPGMDETLDPRDLHRLALIAARAAQRTGRAALSGEIYRNAYLAEPDSAEALLGYVLAIARSSPALAGSLLEGALRSGYAFRPNELVIVGETLLALDRPDAAAGAFMAAMKGGSGGLESSIGIANLSITLADEPGWLAALLRYGARSGLTITGRRTGEPCAPFSFDTDHVAGSVVGLPMVSVVMTCFNAERTVERAIRSVLAQTVASVEVIVVDDVSTDGSREILARIAAAEPRVKLLLNDENMGTYRAKNRGFEIAGGEFVTFHDSDDWMHPTRIERHLAEHPRDAVCSTSRWIRMDEGGRIFAQRSGSYTHLNPASTFVRRATFIEMRGFDTVRVGADAEFLARARARYGEAAVVSLDACLAIGLHHPESLTQSGAAAFDEHRYSPVRLAYTEAWIAWHLTQQAKRGRYDLVTEGQRSFACPPAIDVSGG